VYLFLYYGHLEIRLRRHGPKKGEKSLIRDLALKQPRGTHFKITPLA
jgi:hypothetical protein